MTSSGRKLARSDGGAEDRGPFFIPVAVLLIYLLWRGYVFGYGDQDEVIPYLLHLLDPDLLAKDWFVDYQTNHFGPRTIFVWLCYPLAQLLGISTTFLTLFLISFFATAGALHTLAWDLTRDRIAAAASVLAILVCTPKFTLGGNDLITHMLTPSMPAWSLALWSLVMCYRGRPVFSATLAGIAAWPQALVGLQIGILIGLLLVWQRSRSAWKFALVFGLASLPALGPLIVQQLSPVGDEGNLFYTLFAFRAPHHYLPSSFTGISAVGFTLIGIGGLASIHQLQHVLAPEGGQWVKRILVVVGAACLVGFFCAEVVPVTSVVKLQLFKMTVTAKVFLGILICGAISTKLPGWFRAVARFVLDHSRAAFLAVTLGLAGFAATGMRPSMVPPVEQWARAHTPPSAVFAVPPSWDGFRSRAQRPIIINFKAFPFFPGLENEWLERLHQVAPIDRPERGFFGILDSLDHSFLTLSPEKLLSVSKRYGASYVVRDKQTHAAPLLLEFEGDGWWVYRISPDALP